MVRRASLTAVVFALAAACGDDPAPAPAPPTPGPPACAEGERATPDGCEIARPIAPCPPGTREALGSEACAPVGVAACAAGFEPHPSGWGCRPVMPKTACVGATREALGQTACVAVGDCAAAFPPAGATYFVDAALPDGSVDATHHKSIAAALAAAPAGATIAVEAGRYAESLLVTKDVTIVGRCPAQVVIEGADVEPVVKVLDRRLSLRGVTLSRGRRGLRAEGPARVTLADAVIEDSLVAGIDAFDGPEIEAARVVVRGTREGAAGQITNGVLADFATVRLVDSVVAGAADAGIGVTGGGSARLERSVVRDPVPRSDRVGGSAVRAFLGARVDLVEGALVGARGVAIVAGSRSTRIGLERSSVVDTRLDDRPGLETSTSVSVQDGASLSMTDVTVADVPGSAIAVRKPDTKGTLTRTVVVNVTADRITGGGGGVSVTDKARLTLTDSAVIDTIFSGVTADLAGAELTMERSLVAGTKPARGGGKVPPDTGGYGVLANRGGSAVVRDSTLVDARDLGAIAAVEGSTLRVERTLVARTKKDGQDRFGHGLLALLGGRLFTDGAVVEANAGAGLLFDRGGGVVRGTTVLANEIGIHVQEGAELLEGDPGEGELEDNAVWVTPDTRFVRNLTRVGSGQLAVPQVF